MKFRINRGALLGGLVAVVGSSVALGSAFALYTKIADPLHVNISAHTTDDIALQIENLSDTTEGVISPDNDQTLTFDLSAQKTASSTYSQSSFVAVLQMTISSNSEDAINALKASSIALGTSSNLGEKTNYYSGYWANQSISFASSEVSDNEGTYSITAFKALPIPVIEYEGTAAETLEATANISLGEIDDSAFVNLDGASYDVDIDLREVNDTDEFKFAYVVCDGSAWSEQDAYRMVINPKAEGFEWMFTDTDGLLSDGMSYKVKVGDTWYPADSNMSWSTSNNSIFLKDGNVSAGNI